MSKKRDFKMSSQDAAEAYNDVIANGNKTNTAKICHNSEKYRKNFEAIYGKSKLDLELEKELEEQKDDSSEV